jgi:hypothetical protein
MDMTYLLVRVACVADRSYRAGPLGLDGLLGHPDAEVVGQLPAQVPGHGQGGQADRGQHQRTHGDGVRVAVGALPPEEVADVRAGDRQVEAHVDEPRAERPRAGRDPEQVEEPDERRQQRADHADRDQPHRALREEPRRVDDARRDVEHQPGHPRPDGHGHQDRVEGMPVRPRQHRADRLLRLPHVSFHDAS